jgi:SOS-response transcriptional repressor LexA
MSKRPPSVPRQPAVGSTGGRTQARVLRFIRSYIGRHTYGPTIAEIAEGVGIAKSNAWRHVTELAREGKIVKRWRRARSIRLPATDGEIHDVSRETGGH